MAKVKTGYISMWPDDFVRGGLLDDVDVEVAEAVFEIWDYDPDDAGKGSIGLETLALKLTMTELTSSEVYTQFWSAGDPDRFVIADEEGEVSDLGIALKPSSVAHGVNSNTNVAQLMSSLAECGFPKDKLQEFDSRCLAGLQMHVERIPAPVRPGLKQEPAGEGRERTVLVCSKIIRLPGEKGKTATKRKTRKADTATQMTLPGTEEEPETTGADEEAAGIVKLALEAEGGMIEQKSLRIAVLKLMAKTKEVPPAKRSPVAKLVADEEWLLANGFTIEDGSVMEAG